MNSKRLGIDLAKNSFSLCGVDSNDHIVLEKTVKRNDLLPFVSQLTPCIVGMEAGSGAHHWARELAKLGHTPRIMAPKFVTPYRRQGKNDSNDARAICEAVGRPGMRFVPHKNTEQQAILAVHRIRASHVDAHTKLANQVRGLLAEFGIVIPKGVQHLRNQWREIRQRYDETLPQLAWEELDSLYEQFIAAHRNVLAYDRKVNAIVRTDIRCQRLMQLHGVGPITASAMVATVGDASVFKNGRQFAAWLGLTPRQYSTGGKPKLGRISKQGDSYLRTLLVHGARTELTNIGKRSDSKSQWAQQLRERKSWNKAAVALANKHARLIWAVLTKGDDFIPVY
jgi:transposase